MKLCDFYVGVISVLIWLQTAYEWPLSLGIMMYIPFVVTVKGNLRQFHLFFCDHYINDIATQ